jgi:hypothetical protein
VQERMVMKYDLQKRKRKGYLYSAVRDNTTIFNERYKSTTRRNGNDTNEVKTAYKAGEIPAKILAFFKTPTVDILALIHPTEFTKSLRRLMSYRVIQVVI